MEPDNARYVWIAARARNALRRRTLMSSIAGLVFVSVLLGLIASPHDAPRVQATATPPAAQKNDDTTCAIDALILAHSWSRQAVSALAVARRVISLEKPPVQPPRDTL